MVEVTANTIDPTSGAETLQEHGSHGPIGGLMEVEPAQNLRPSEEGSYGCPIDLDVQLTHGGQICADLSTAQGGCCIAGAHVQKSRKEKRKRSAGDWIVDCPLEKWPRRSGRPRKHTVYIDWTDARISEELKTLESEQDKLEAEYITRLSQLDQEFEQRSDELQVKRSMLESLTRRIGYGLD